MDEVLGKKSIKLGMPNGHAFNQAAILTDECRQTTTVNASRMR
ncbi:MAG: hypothetical protein Q7T62_12615 [Undibacterium sp.]|nr:hypothetical protein [Undibacterium sp.]MDO8702648.1 hypothetical protein [Undibacterium sp.]